MSLICCIFVALMHIMETNNHQINDYSAVLDKQYGKEGSLERSKFDEEAYAFYTGQILLNARKEAKVTQSELARRINASKSYISRIENGSINPSVSTFYRIINALGLRIEILKPLGV
jgi:DNA-binding XRE family transcriptional regulator